MISIQTNVNSLVAQQNLSVNSAFQSKTIQQLTSGYRINQSGDDAAGLAVANKFRSTVAELTQGVANGNDATAQLQIMDGGMNNISLILDRLKTLATQSASGTFTGNRSVLNAEFQNALSEIDRQAQSIGLNTGGLFAKNLDVFLGAGSGSSSLQNGIVTLGLTQSAVDSQSLGMRGMLAVNLTSGTLSGTNAGTDIGSTSATSVQNIVSNVSGANLNQQATAGYAALQFSGAGFSDAGKVAISVNLAGVTDVATLVTAVNGAIQSAGNGTTAAATAFKNANIVASVHTDTSGGQQLAFSSGTAAFQVQAGDQMANALLGNVAVVGGVAKGTAVAATAATTVTGAITKAGTFDAAQTVKLVVTGGGLASPVTLSVNTASTVSTTAAITDLENQFTGSAALQAAGLTMSGSSTVGGTLSFNSASGQGFNIQVTGDSANLLGLGSFLADSAGNADYTSITGGTAYSAATVTGNSTTAGLAAGLEISLNGAASLALTGIDMTAGAHAVAASATSSASIGGGTGEVDILATNRNLNVTVINNGVVNNQVIALGVSATVATSGAKVSSVTAAAIDGGAAITVSSDKASLTNSFMVAVDGGTAVKVTLADGTYSTAADFLTEVNTQLTANFSGAVTASYALLGAETAGNGTGALTLTSALTTGVASSVRVSAATTATMGTVTSLGGGTPLTSLDAGLVAGTFSVTAAARNNKFMVSKDGAAAVEVTIADNATYDATTFLAAVNAATNMPAGVTASWAGGTGALTLTSNTTGAASSVAVSAATYATSATAVSSVVQSTYAPITIAAGPDNTFKVAIDGGASATLTVVAATYATAANFLTAVQNAISGSTLAGTVTAAYAGGGTGALTFTAVSTGAASSINVSAGASGTVLADLGFGAGGTTHGTAATANTGLAKAGFSTVTTANGNSAAANAGLTTTMGLVAGIGSGDADTPITAAAIAAQIQSAFGADATVTVSNDYKISIASTTKGANSSVSLNATANSAYSSLNLSSPVAVAGANSTIADVVDNLNAQFAANGTAFQAAGLKAAATLADGTGSGNFITIKSNNGTQFRLNAVGAAAVETSGKVSSSVTVGSLSATSSIVVAAGTTDQFKVAVDGGTAVTLTVANATYTSGATFLTAVQNAIAGSSLTGLVTAGWDAATRRLTLTSVETGTASSVTTSAVSGNTGLANLGFGTGATNSGQLFSHTEDTGFGVAGSTFVGAAASSTGTAMSVTDAFGVSNSTAFTFSAMKYGNDKQALTFSATDANGVLETKTITLQNNASTNRAGASIDDAVAYINTQLQQSTSQPALQQIVAVKENVGGEEKINFVSSLSGFTVGVAATASGDGLNSGAASQAVQRVSEANGDGANMQVDSKEAAKAAVTALVTAVGKLGAAQAAVGKGQNQLYYAVNLAQSQISNFSAAESYLRDANVAQQAANLTKAQVLSQASIAAMAQANSAPQAVLALLRG